MDRIADAESFKSLSLQFEQTLTAMIHSAANHPILPSCMLHVLQLLQFIRYLLGTPAILWQSKVMRYARSSWNKFGLELDE